MYVTCPTKGSDMILNASAENGCSSEARRSAASSFSGLVPSTGGTSSGDGRKSTTASSSGWMPLFLKAEPASTGVIFNAMVERRMEARSSSGVKVCSERNFSRTASSCSATYSTTLLRCSSRSEEHTSELQSQSNLVCRLLLEKKKKI